MSAQLAFSLVLKMSRESEPTAYRQIIERATNVSSEEQLRVAGADVAKLIGFETFSISYVTPSVSGPDHFQSVWQLPSSYLRYFFDPSRSSTDPVMQHCKVRHTPICWDQKLYVDATLGERWEHLAQHGLASGVAVALHLPKGRHVFAGSDRSAALPSGEELDDVVGRLQTFCAAIVEPAFAIYADKVTDGNSELTRLQRECLQWAMEGKTAHETAIILGLSHSRISKVLSGALRTLDCVTKSQAVVKALRLNLL